MRMPVIAGNCTSQTIFLNRKGIGFGISMENKLESNVRNSEQLLSFVTS